MLSFCCGPRDGGATAIPTEAQTQGVLKAKLGPCRDIGNLKVDKSRGGKIALDEMRTLADPASIFDLKEVIGQGSFGVVHRAIDVRDGKEVAVKIIDLDSDEKFLAIENECRCHFLATPHPNICSLYGVFEQLGWLEWLNFSGRRAWIVMELCKKGSLRDQLRRKGPKNAKNDAVKYIKSMYETAEHLHSNNIIFRDMKPENWLVGNDGNLLLSDFGSATILPFREAVITEEAVVGSPGYLAPESWAGQYSTKCDVWGIGVIATEIVSGHNPFYFAELRIGELLQQSQGDVGAAIKHLHDEVMNHNVILPKEVDSDCKDFINLVLHKDPDQRPSCEIALSHTYIR